MLRLRLCDRLRGQREERFAFFHDVGGEPHAVAAGDVLRGVDRSGGDEQDIAGLQRHRRLTVELILERAIEHVDDLFALSLIHI